ncbi:MAG: TIGR01212 family radical SAM protein [Clostridia bacterium]|nr:TIGR01212 family radical SAM protein [Clostridia bacterium]
MFIFTLNDYCRKTYGEKLYKVSLDGGMTCPNRDGKLDTRGCIFCSRGGSGDFAVGRCESVCEQIERAKLRIADKCKGAGLIAYFQSYSGTYAPVGYLKELFYSAAQHPEVKVISIATRPDCLDHDVLQLLCELNIIKPVWIELGLQTSNENTAKYIRRGYENECYKQAVGRLRDIGIYVITHVILYLPGESVEDMENTLRFVTACGSDGIKLSLLHVLRDTDLEKEYEQGKVILPDMEEYLDTLTDLLELLPPDMAIHRMTGDGPKSILIAPLWTGDKKKVLNRLKRVMEEKDTTQGRRWKLEQN